MIKKMKLPRKQSTMNKNLLLHIKSGFRHLSTLDNDITQQKLQNAYSVDKILILEGF